MTGDDDAALELCLLGLLHAHPEPTDEHVSDWTQSFPQYAVDIREFVNALRHVRPAEQNCVEELSVDERARIEHATLKLLEPSKRKILAAVRRRQKGVSYGD